RRSNAMRLTLFAAIFALFLSPLARADIVASAPGAFMISAEADVAATPQQTYAALVQIGRWWSSDHTYSGAAVNLSIDPHAGGCFCERWSGGSVQHGQIVMAFARDNTRMLRIMTALGPLQEMGVTGVWTFTITPRQGASGAHIVMNYRVSGDPAL